MDQIKMAIKQDQLLRLPVTALHEFQGNLKDLSVENYDRAKKSILELGYSFAVHAWEHEGKHYILDGHQRIRTMLKMAEEGYAIPAVPTVLVEADNYKQAKKKVLAGTSQYGQITGQGLYEFISESGMDWRDVVRDNRFPEIEPTSFVSEFYGESSGGSDGGSTTSLADRFLVPPFSVLDTRQGYWQDRKRFWLGLGIESEVGRKENLLGMSATVLEPDPKKRKKMLTGEKYDGGNALSGSGSGTSIFDPVLCELVYRWFSPQGGAVLDPFAGGSVRGIVASKIGLNYHGCDLRQEQIEANEKQAKAICEAAVPRWKCGDSLDIKQHFKGLEADLIFSCPPYADLERYSDDPKDLSTMDYKDFAAPYRAIIAASVALLKPNRFACFVVGEVREKKGSGFYRNFVMDTISAFEAAGARYYNEMILVTSVGTLAIRCGRVFEAGRKIGKTHQNVLVFCKGDPKLATKACGPVFIPPMEGSEDEGPHEAEV